MDPATLQFTEFIKANGVAVAILAFVAAFIWIRLWPWYIKEYFPAILAREKAEATEREQLRKAISDLTLIVQGIPAALQLNLAANVQQSLVPQLQQMASQYEVAVTNAREASDRQFGDRLTPVAQDVAGLKELLRTHVLESKLRHDAMLSSITTMGNELTTVFLGLHGPGKSMLSKTAELVPSLEGKPT